LYYPERRYLPDDRLDFFALKGITFEAPDMVNFPALRLAYEAGRIGGSLPTVFNAANEWAVAKFLDRKISYLDIARLIGEAMDNHKVIESPSVEEILETEASAYEFLESKF
jgi:1-deoxy-D-xylulose-5-phosphate reductoisomerase